MLTTNRLFEKTRLMAAVDGYVDAYQGGIGLSVYEQ
jgi:hypothetical protein